MKTRLLLCGAGATAALLLAFAPVESALRFAPAVGTSAAKTMVSELELELDDLSVTVDGEDVLAMFGTPTFRMTAKSSLAVDDEYAAVGGGRPLRLVRSFGDMSVDMDVSVEMAGEGDNTKESMGSKLSGKKVVFTWNEETGEYTVAWAPDHSGEDGLLEGLEEDLDLRMLLPEGSVAPGDTWEISADALMALSMPGGDLAWDTGEGEESAEMEAMMEDIFEKFFGGGAEELLKGTRTATFQGLREVDGVSLGVVAIKIDIEIEMDLADMILDVIRSAGEMPEEVSFELSRAMLSGQMKVEGELLWNTTLGLLHAMELEGDFNGGLELEASLDMMGEAADMSASVLFSGTQKNRMSAQIQ